MKNVILFGIKIIANILIPGIFVLTNDIEKKYLFIMLFAIIINIIPIVIIIKRKREYRERYLRKKYVMEKSIIMMYIFIDNICIMLFYFLCKSYAHLWCYFGSHIVFNIIMSFFLLNIDPKKILKRSKIKEKFDFEYGVIKGAVIVDNKAVLEEGEKVQVLEKFDVTVLIRKGTGDEYAINKNMIEIKSF